jgi:hypothetical protein
MSRRLRLSLWIAGIAAILVVLLLAGLYLAARHEPAFYRAAMEANRAALEKGSDRMLRKGAALQSLPTKLGRWEIRITAEEINGWLAVDLPKNHPKALPPTLRDPRVVIHPDEVTVACRYEQNGVETVLSLTVQPYVGRTGNVSDDAAPYVIAVRIVRVRAGLLPLPLKQVTDGLSQAARDMRFQLQWGNSGGDPVAMISLPTDSDDGQVVRIETLRLSEGEIYLAGKTERRKP